MTLARAKKDICSDQIPTWSPLTSIRTIRTKELNGKKWSVPLQAGKRTVDSDLSYR